jgi:ubiquinone/menaquinone biosynthesis C-methylase UbiE
MKGIKTSTNIQTGYDEQYNDRMTLWREIGGKYKYQNILNAINGKSFKKVLDFGAGEGSILKFFDESSLFEELYALEISDSGIAQIKKRELKKLRELKKFNGYNTEYSDNEFDLVYCSHVIEHVEHPRLVLREIKRISKYQVFEIPLDYSKNVDSKIKHFLGYGHINIFTPSLFKFLLKSEGFTIENEIHTDTAKEVLKFNYYQNLGLKKNIKRKIFIHLVSNKSKIARVLVGDKKSKEFYHSAYTCFTRESGDLKIF